MSFVLRGNPRSLRFSGEAKALALPKPDGAAAATAAAKNNTASSIALGKPRVRRPPTPPNGMPINTPTPSGVREGPPSRRPDAYGVETIATPYASSSPPSPIVRRHGSPMLPPAMQAMQAMPVQLDTYGFPNPPSESDENPTMAMDRDGLDVMPGGGRGAGGNGVTKPAFPPSAIPNFRPAHMVGQQMMGAPGVLGAPQHAEARPRGAPLIVWIAAAMLAGIVSYLVAPELLLSSPKTAAQVQVPPPASATP